jgi:hypothetical protein
MEAGNVGCLREQLKQIPASLGSGVVPGGETLVVYHVQFGPMCEEPSRHIPVSIPDDMA